MTCRIRYLTVCIGLLAISFGATELAQASPATKSTANKVADAKNTAKKPAVVNPLDLEDRTNEAAKRHTIHSQVGRNYNRIEASIKRESYSGPPFKAQYHLFKKELREKTGISYTFDSTAMPQWGAPSGRIIAAQGIVAPSVNWDLYTSKYLGVSSLQFFYQGIGYANKQKNGSALSNNLNVANPVNDYTNQGNEYQQLTFTQILPKDIFSVAVGLFPISNFDSNAYADNQQINFINYAMSQNGTSTYATSGMGAFVQAKPSKEITVIGGFQNASNISGDSIDWNTFGNGPTASFINLNWRPFNPLNEYSLILYKQPAVPQQPLASKGWSLSLSQYVNKHVGLFLRANRATGSTFNIDTSVAGGAVYNNPLNRNPLDQIGLGYAYNVVNKSVYAPQYARGNEQVIEAYWAWSFARSFQITPDVQLYLNPALKEKKQLAAAYSLRAAVLL